MVYHTLVYQTKVRENREVRENSSYGASGCIMELLGAKS